MQSRANAKAENAMKRSIRTFAMLMPLLAATSALAQQAPLPIAQPQQGNAQVNMPVQPVAANINITPRRVIFDRSKRSEAVYVFNQGTTPVTVNVALVDNAMLPSGEIVPVSRLGERGDAGEAVAARVRSAAPFLLAAPSRLTLGPGQGKTVRVRATLADGSAPSEYRSHLTVTTIPSQDSGLTAQQAAATERGELVLRIQSVFGISIPLIVRGGTPDATGSIGTILPGTMPDGTPALVVRLRRQGATSLYGNIELRSGSEIIGMVRGVAVYAETDERVAMVPLMRPLKKGERVTASYIADDGAKALPIASGSYSAP